ncbi:dihydroorotase [Candidatus Peregrinibacteria bacterium]|nr:dihydroorotase [Candidatus Peregrinibacteria bacterium]
MKKFVLRNGEVASVLGLLKADVYVDNGVIVKVSSDVGKAGKSDFEEIDCSSKVVMPGVIDVHVHFREPGEAYKEDFETGSAAAVWGGVTTVFDMPNNKPPTSSIAALKAKRKLIAGRSFCNYGFYILFDGNNIEEINRASGICGVKVYCAHSTGNMGVFENSLEKAFKEIRRDKVLVFHSEDENCIEENKKAYLAEFEGREVPASVHSKIRDGKCALMMTQKLCELAKKYKRPIHIAHVSTDAEMDLIEQYREFGVTCEVTPHHLVFADDDYEYFGNLIKVNPPIRERSDIFGLWKHLKMGNIDLIASDHAPHALVEKELPYVDAPAGIAGVQTMLPIFLNSVNDEGLSFGELVRFCCALPAEIFGLKSKGKIEEGYDADIVVVDMEKEKTFRREDVLSKCGFSPYVGNLYKGWPVKIFVGGELVCDEGKIIGKKVGKEVF